MPIALPVLVPGTDVSSARRRKTHEITCKCCGKKARVPITRSRLCDYCFKNDGHEENSLLSGDDRKRMTRWLIKHNAGLKFGDFILNE